MISTPLGVPELEQGDAGRRGHAAVGANPAVAGPRRVGLAAGRGGRHSPFRDVERHLLGHDHEDIDGDLGRGRAAFPVGNLHPDGDRSDCGRRGPARRGRVGRLGDDAVRCAPGVGERVVVRGRRRRRSASPRPPSPPRTARRRESPWADGSPEEECLLRLRRRHRRRVGGNRRRSGSCPRR